MKTVLQSVFGRMSSGWAASGRRPERRRVRPGLEFLDRRDVPTVGLVGADLVISATNNGGQVLIQNDNRGSAIKSDDLVRVNWTHNGTVDTYAFAASKVTHVTFYGSNAADTVENQTQIHSDMYGYGGNDKLTGGSGQNALYGGLGDDELHGGAGTDNLVGGSGSDKLFGDGGDDTLDAYQSVNGLPDVDPLFSKDELDGGTGKDWMIGGRKGMNIMHGGADDDTIRGGDDALNYLFGDGGDDLLVGGIGISCTNQLDGGKGSDTLVDGAKATNILNGGDDTEVDTLYATQPGTVLLNTGNHGSWIDTIKHHAD